MIAPVGILSTKKDVRQPMVRFVCQGIDAPVKPVVLEYEDLL
jgi:hypothetical protein